MMSLKERLFYSACIPTRILLATLAAVWSYLRPSTALTVICTLAFMGSVGMTLRWWLSSDRPWWNRPMHALIYSIVSLLALTALILHTVEGWPIWVVFAPAALLLLDPILGLLSSPYIH